MKLIDEWKQAYKYLTVQLTIGLGALSVAYEYLPEMKQILPDGWYKYGLMAILIARVIQQSSVKK
jgi:hypothetical protein